MLLIAGALVAPAFAAAASVSVAPATLKIRPSTAAGIERTARLQAARNEFEAFQIVLQAQGSPLEGVTAKASPLRGPAGSIIPASAVSLYREALINVTSPSGSIGRTGRWPDALVPAVDELDGEGRNAFPMTVPAGETRAIWVDVLVPRDAVPGLYRGTVSIEGRDLRETLDVELEVWNFELPSTPSLATAFLAYSGNVCLAHTGSSDCGGPVEAAQLLGRYERLALDHRLTVPNIFVLRNDGTDWSAFDAVYGPLLDGTADTRLPGARMTSAQYTWKRDAASYRTFADHFRAKGWLERAYDYTADEPPWGDEWSDIPSRARIVKSGAPDMKVLVTTHIDGAEENGALDSIDLMVPIVNHLEGTKAPFDGDQRPKYDRYVADGNTLWSYQSCMSHGCSFGGGEAETQWPSYMIDVPALRNRIMQWADFNERVTGELYYETVLAFNKDPWTSQFEFNGNGAGPLFYRALPPEADARGQRSLRVPHPALEAR